jgi:hypothetical protein
MTIFCKFGGDSEIYLFNNDTWCLKSSKGVEIISEKTEIISLLPILEIGFDTFYRIVKENQIPLNVVEQFPINAVLCYPFEKELAHWANDAILWISFIQKTEEFTQWAYTIKRHWMPQKLMHQFRKAFKLPKD